MFLGSDRPFALAADFGPGSFCEDGPWEPTEIESQVVKASQIMSDTVPVRVNDGEKIFSGRLDKRFIANGVICFAAKTSRTASLSGWNSVRCHFVHHCLPGSLRHFRIVCGEVCTRKIEIERGLTMRFVHRV